MEVGEVVTATEAVVSERERTNEQAGMLACVITTAMEGGIGYWSRASVYRWWDPYLGGGTAEHKGVQANAYATIREHGETTDLVVTTDKVEDAMRRIVTERATLRVGGWMVEAIQLALDENEAGDIDADVADVIVQVAVLGEVRYG